jgi:hypothetical protein
MLAFALCMFLFVARSKQVYIGWLEAAVLSVYLLEEERTSIYARSSFLATLPPGPAQLNLYEPASSNRNVAYSQHF